jgi:hypothetical protein
MTELGGEVREAETVGEGILGEPSFSKLLASGGYKKVGHTRPQPAGGKFVQAAVRGVHEYLRNALETQISSRWK